MPRVTATVQTLVWFEVRGQDVPIQAGVAYPKDDAGLVGRLLEYLNQNHIYTSASCGFFRPGECAFAVRSVQDADAVVAWLKEQQVDVDLVS